MIKIDSLTARTCARLGQRGSIFGMAALDAVKDDKSIVILTADLASLSGMERFIKTFPENYINVGIAEQNMVGISAGLASEGYNPVVTTYATFITLRSCEQIRHYLGYMGLKVVVIGSGAGLIQAFSGNTHYSIEDLAVMRSIPNMSVLSPSDATQAIKAFEKALTSSHSVYIRLSGGLNCPIVYKDDYDFKIGQAIVVNPGNDIVVFATGMMVSNSIKAAKILEQSGLSVKVVDVHTIKPVHSNLIYENLSAKLFVSVEEHNIIGGLGSAVAEKAVEIGNTPSLLRLGIKDQFCKVGDYDFLLSENRLQPEQIAEDILSKFNSL